MPKKTEIDHYSDKEALDFHLKGSLAKLRSIQSKTTYYKERSNLLLTLQE